MVAKKLDLDFVNRRATQRFDYGEVCTLMLANRRMRGMSANISAGGMAIQLQSLGRIDQGDRVSLQIGEFPAIRACVCWMNARKVGVQFDEPLDGHPDIRALLDRLENGTPVPIPVEDVQITETIAKDEEKTLAKAVAEVAESVARATDRSGTS